MVPVKLSLKNFLSYGDAIPLLDFREFSIACLSGKNGHGKSALIDAITWALWGRCRARTKEDVIKRGTSEAGVELEFEADGNLYRVLRRITRKRGTSTSTRVDFQVFDRGTDSFRPIAQDGKAQDSIERVLKMDYDSFICSSFILQGKADEFTKRTPAERKEILGSILELEKYERLARKARDLVQKLRLEEEVLRREETRLRSEISRKGDLERELEEIKTREIEITRELKESEGSYEEIIRESEILGAKVELYRGLIRDRDETGENCTRLEEDLKGIIETMEIDRGIIEREEEILRGYGEFEKTREEERVLSERLMVYTKLLKELEEVNLLINKERSKLENKIGSLSGKKEELDKRLAQTREILRREEEIRKGFKGFLDTEALERDFERRRQISERLKSRRVELENTIQRIRFEIEARIKGLESKIEGLTSRVQGIKGIEEECENLRAEIRAYEEMQKRSEELRVRLKEIGEEKRVSIWRRSEVKSKQEEEKRKLDLIRSEVHKTQCPLCESPLGEGARELLIEKFERSLLDLENALKEEAERMNRLEGDEKKVSSEIEELESRTRRLSELNKRLGERERSLEDSKSASRDLESALRELGDLKGRIERGDFGSEFKDELRRVTEELESLDYDEKRHGEIKKRLEALRVFQVESKLLEEAMRAEVEIEKELARIRAQLVPLTRELEEGLFAPEHREKVLRIQSQIGEIAYDGERHRELKNALVKLERFSKEKEDLDRAKLSLSLREKERETIERRLEEERTKLLRLEGEIKGLEEAVGQSKRLEEKKGAIQVRISTLKRDRDEALGQKSRVLNEIERIVKLESRREEILRQIDKTVYDLTVYQELEKAFGKNGIQALIIENAVPEIEDEANRILKKLTEGTMTLSLDMVKPTQKGGEKETLDIKIADSSGTRGYETYSGGEAFRIDFALRVAISKFIANRSGAQLRTLVIDEGFGTQDKDGLNQFIQVINTIKDDFDKVLVITHVDELKERFPVRIEVTKEPGRGSTFEVIYS
jgi:exonuclease SbcC